MIKLRVDDETAIPLSVDSSSAVSMTVSEAFIDRGGSAIQNNKNATPSTSQVVVTPDPGYDAMGKVTVEAMPQGALSPIDIDFDDDTGAFTASARVGTSGYIPDTAFVGGGFQLATQAAAAITPTNVQRQAVAAHKYTTGAVVVDPIPSEYIIPTGTKNITANGNNQDVKAYEKVNVDVPNSYSASDEGKVVQSGALVSQSSQTVTENGTYDTTLKNEVVVDVSGGGGGSNYVVEEQVVAGANTVSNMYQAGQYLLGLCSANMPRHAVFIQREAGSPSPVNNEFGGLIKYFDLDFNGSTSTGNGEPYRYRSGWASTSGYGTNWDAKISVGSIFTIIGIADLQFN